MMSYTLIQLYILRHKWYISKHSLWCYRTATSALFNAWFWFDLDLTLLVTVVNKRNQITLQMIRWGVMNLNQGHLKIDHRCEDWDDKILVWAIILQCTYFEIAGFVINCLYGEKIKCTKIRFKIYPLQFCVSN